jgi:hypothetical protein
MSAWMLYLATRNGSVQGVLQTQEEIVMKKSFANICLMVSFLGMSMALTDSAVGQERALASGSFRCSVTVIDPPDDQTYGGASMYFNNILGIIGGPVETYIDIGNGSALEAICEELASTIHSLAHNQTCTVSTIQKRESVFGNGTSSRWSFDVLCNSKQTNVIDAISNILEGLLITPLVASQTIQEKSNEMR